MSRRCLRMVALTLLTALPLVVGGCKSEEELSTAEMPQVTQTPAEQEQPMTDRDPVEAARTLGTASENPVVETDSGLQYIAVAEGDGEEAKAGDTVSVHYTGWLVDGNKFDSSRDRGQPFVFPLGAGRVIKGWDEGVAGMKVGGIRKLIVPPELGYGERSIGPIPPNSTLIFEVELLEVR